MGPKPVFLDVDSTIVEKNLLITEDPSNEIGQLLECREQYPSKLVKPFPGFCVKTKEVGTDQKLFVNICQTDALPPPDDITESELAHLCNSDEICNYKIPLSIGEVHVDSDKKGNDVKVVDVAINTNFFKKLENSVLLKNFLLTVVFEGLRDKHNVHASDERLMLKNKRAYGTLQLHRIQQREIDNKIRSEGEILIDSNITDIKPTIEVLSEKLNVIPDYRLFKIKDQHDVLYAEIKLENAFDSDDFTLEVGEDRIVFQSKKYLYYLDIYLPFDINSENATSTFNTQTKILALKMIIQNERNL